MPPGSKNPKDEARFRLQEKLSDVKSKVKDIHDTVTNISQAAIAKAEEVLLLKSKSKFMGLYPKASQELEICLNQLLLISHAISSGGLNDSDGSESENEQENNEVKEERPSFEESVVQSSVVSDNEQETLNTATKCRKRTFAEVQSSNAGPSGSNIECNLCGRYFASKISLKNHFKTRHTPYEEWPYVCTLCPEGQQKRYSLSNRLKEHVEFKHFGHASSMCELCGKKFGRPNHKEKHIIHCANLKKKPLQEEENQNENRELSEASINSNTEIDSVQQIRNDNNENMEESLESDEKLDENCKVHIGILNEETGTVEIPIEEGTENLNDFIDMSKHIKDEENIAVMIIPENEVSTTNIE